ncbi:hypothetical protein ACQ4PT_059068 [Festuca glaucescens]
MLISIKFSTSYRHNEEERRRTCLARLVNNVYLAVEDVRALEPEWLKSCGLSLEEVLKDKGIVYAATYKYIREGGPEYIVAFRGTTLRRSTIMGDMRLNLRIVRNTVTDSTRFQLAYEKVKNLMFNSKSNCVIWLAGHSQGAALALSLGQDMMAKEEGNLPAFLFNPPLPIIHMFPKWAKKTLHWFHGTRPAPSPQRMQALSSWVPEVYVHEKDFISKSFITYFEHPEQLDKVGNSAMLLPSAKLWKNAGKVDGGAHGLEQWWKRNKELTLIYKPYGSGES